MLIAIAGVVGVFAVLVTAMYYGGKKVARLLDHIAKEMR